ncbi:antibiotic biosynthesis monooxygenase [Flavobacteriales bacterium 34_180_T64]|nr:antibiotic biosynthesis monooxygenase [Flavobacteriales bacterium 34_180_T64]
MTKSFKSYYAVIFTSIQTDNTEGYDEMASTMEELAKLQPGYLGIDSARNEVGITISYWENLEAIKNWKQETEHLKTQLKGRTQWYDWYHVRICKVEREYEFNS